MKTFYSKHPLITIWLQAFLLSSVIILLSCSLASFIYPHIAMQPYYNDPSTFVIMGKEMIAGKTPFVEIFDHKGLYIFYITVLWAVMGRFGIFLTMAIFVTISLVFLILTFKELDYGHHSTVVGLLLFAALYTFFAQFPGDADLVVMVGMIMFYFHVKGYKNENDKCYLIACILAGISAGIALNIRPSDAMLGFAYMVFYLVKRIKEKKWTILLRDATLCLAFLVLTALPAYIHAYAGHFLNEMIDAVFLSNLKYLGTATDKSIVLVWLSRLIVLAIFVTLFLLWFFKRKEYKLEESLFILINSGVICVVQFAIALFAHYLISVSGFIILALMMVVSKYKLLEEGKKSTKPITYAVISVFGLSLLFNPMLYLTHYELDRGDIAYMKENISEEDRKEHTFLFSVYPGLYLNAGVEVIYPDFNAQVYHVKISEKYNIDHMAAFVRSEKVKYFVTRESGKEYAAALFGNENYVEIPNNTGLPTTITIYQHVI